MSSPTGGGGPARRPLRPQVTPGLAGLPKPAPNAAKRRATPQDGAPTSGGRPQYGRAAGKRQERKPRPVPDPYGESKADMAAWAVRTYRALWRVEGSAYWREEWTRPELAEALEAVRREAGL